MSNEETNSEEITTGEEEFTPLNITITVNITLDSPDGQPMVSQRTRLNGQPVDFPFAMVAGGGENPVRLFPNTFTPQMMACYTVALQSIIANMVTLGANNWIAEREETNDGN